MTWFETMAGNQRDLLARVGEVVGDVRWRADDALELRGIRARLLGRAASGVHDPLDDLGVGKWMITPSATRPATASAFGP